jgi:hypothetical protein
MRLASWWDGASAELRDAETGDALVELEVWPSDECPRQAAGVTARVLGVQRAKDLTQADGADGSSWCGDPVTVQESRSPSGREIFELRLSCQSEHSEESADGTPRSEPRRASEGTKGPTFFVDVSPSWKTVVLLVDPVGVDPRLRPAQRRPDLDTLRRILATVRIVPAARPAGICIDELPARGLAVGRPTGPRPTP